MPKSDSEKLNDIYDKLVTAISRELTKDEVSPNIIKEGREFLKQFGFEVPLQLPKLEADRGPLPFSQTG